MGDSSRKFTFHDEIKGDVTVTENDQDVVILKSDGIPTYHFAHAVDDHLMRTTLVIRGEEWLASLPIHLELFDVLGFARPMYGHNCSLMKMDGESKRKLSKRKDPELSLSFYRQEGYHPFAVKVYMLTLLNSDFEEWHMKYPEKPLEEFRFRIEKMSRSGALFDLDKLNDISKTELSRLSAEEMLAFLKDWAFSFGSEREQAYFADEEYLLKVLNLCMGTSGKKRRKDFVTAKQAVAEIGYFFGDRVQKDAYRVDDGTRNAILDAFLAKYEYADDAQAWFAKVKEVAAGLGYAAEMRDYKANPEVYKGSVSDVAEVLRIAVTGRANSPNLWTIMQILGDERARARLSEART